MRSSPASIYSTIVSRSINMLSVTDLSQKKSFPGSEFKPASIWTCWMQIDRQMQSAFMPELHRWISKLTARHLQGPPGDLLITMVKETVILYQKEFRKMKKSRISHWSGRDENAKWLRDCQWLCQACNVDLHVDLCKEIFARKHTATHKPTSSQPVHMCHDDTHPPNKLADRHGAPRPPMTDVGTETAFRLEKAQAFPKK